MEHKFDLPEPQASDLENTGQIWGTYYYVKTAKSAGNGIPLKDMQGKDLGPKLSPKDWCLAGVEGTVAIAGAVYNYSGKTGTSQTSCHGFTGLRDDLVRALEKTRWKVAKGPFGDGSGGYILAPFRTLAVDKNTFPLGTTLYVSKARGAKLSLPDGTTAKHDGYFFAGDTGGAITGRHVDFFLGVTETNPFPFVTSASSGKFDVRLVTNAQTKAWLKALHKP